MMPAPKTVAERNQFIYMAWLARNFPAIYNAYVARANSDPDAQLSGFWDSVTAGISKVGSGINSLIQKAPELIAQYGATKEQLAQIKINLDRVRAGKPPVNPDGTPITAGQTVANLPATDAGRLLPVPVIQKMPQWALFSGLGLLLLLLFARR